MLVDLRALSFFKCANFLQNLGVNDQIVARFYRLAAKRNQSFKYPLALLRFIWKSAGPVKALTEMESLDLNSYCTRNIKYYARFQANMAALNLEAGNISQAKYNFKTALKIDSNIGKRFLHLESYFSFLCNNENRRKKKYLMFQYLNQFSLNDLFTGLSIDDIAIVGNSPIEIGRGLGKVIDDHKLVIRFNNFELSESFSADYGSKVDCWVRTPSNNEVNYFKNNRIDKIVITGIGHTEMETDVWKNFETLMNEHKSLYLIPNTIYYDLRTNIGCPPSAGLLILYFMYKHYGKLKQEHLFAFSFSKKHYFQNRFFTSSKHNWRKEYALFCRMLGSI